jgi:hypothetical protein
MQEKILSLIAFFMMNGGTIGGYNAKIMVAESNGFSSLSFLGQ